MLIKQIKKNKTDKNQEKFVAHVGFIKFYFL